MIFTTIPSLYSIFKQSDGVCIDTRSIRTGVLFFALKGPQFNAHDFIEEALEKGANAIVIDEPSFAHIKNTYLVPNVLEALQDLATYHRDQLQLPIIALTGSNGKTTTKELINAVLQTKYVTKATIGNLNNHIGVPLTLLSFTAETQIGVVEMGANHQREIEQLCRIAKPNFGYITNFGKAHLDGFGGVEGVIKGKSEMYTFLREHVGKVFVNADDSLQLKQAEGTEQIKFGYQNSDCDFQIQRVSLTPFVQIDYNGNTISTQLIGSYNWPNITAALAIGLHFSIPVEQIKMALEQYVPSNNRSQVIKKGRHTLLLDAYNANPSSMKAALDSFEQQTAEHKVVILGDMLELGTEAAAEHAHLIQRLIRSNATSYCIGPLFYAHKVVTDQIHFFETREAFMSSVQVSNWLPSLVLIKGSRGMALEHCVTLFDQIL
ncbi:MAG: UDP-N-acetylmuramoyl-tripeptide--D-alanyl-D-alanine ligase [Flavobacterium sp. BFFFF2]|nr:MAG: UDP-N-acetylmuramoyl-tripeptide--D-alanyl-D-alanine ligase [Flavobacterium sp. BFFFF2]